MCVCVCVCVCVCEEICDTYKSLTGTSNPGQSGPGNKDIKVTIVTRNPELEPQLQIQFSHAQDSPL